MRRSMRCFSLALSRCWLRCGGSQGGYRWLRQRHEGSRQDRNIQRRWTTQVMARRRAEVGFCLLILIACGGCRQKTAAPVGETALPAASAKVAQSPASTAAEPVEQRPSGPIQFTDITAQAGIHFTHNSGAFGKKYLPETMGSGVCFIDYDRDGLQDIFLVNSMDWPDHK